MNIDTSVLFERDDVIAALVEDIFDRNAIVIAFRYDTGKSRLAHDMEDAEAWHTCQAALALTRGHEDLARSHLRALEREVVAEEKCLRVVPCG